ncbi:MAG: hypothetical protein RLZZ66_1280 [Pseudomonadota bacterium]|jgi:hypothetical protein
MIQEANQKASQIAVNYIDSTVLDLISNIGKSENKQDETLLALGDKLAEIKARIISEYSNEKDVKLIFNIVKKETASKLKSTDITTINKLVKITTNLKITQYRKEKKIPNRWGTLALLTSIEDEKIEKLVNSGDLNFSITRAELKNIISKEKNVVTSSSSNLIIINDSIQMVKNEDIELVNKLLKEIGWRVKMRNKK